MLLKKWWNISSISIRRRFSNIFSAKIWRCLHSVFPILIRRRSGALAFPVCVRWDKRRAQLKWRVNRPRNCRRRTWSCVFEILSKIKQRPQVSQRKHCLYRTRGLGRVCSVNDKSVTFYCTIWQRCWINSFILLLQRYLVLYLKVFACCNNSESDNEK